MRKLILVLAATAVSATVGGAALADFQSERSVTGPRGNSATVSTERTRTDSGRSTSVTGSTSNGRSWNRDATTSYDPETRTRTRQGSGSTAGGATWSSESTVTCHDGKCYREGVYIGPQGGTTTWSGEAERTAPGEVEGQRSWTGPRGGSGGSNWSWRRIKRSN